MQNLDVTKSHALTDEVKINLDVLGAVDLPNADHQFKQGYMDWYFYNIIILNIIYIK
jgi:hypothetical protein